MAVTLRTSVCGDCRAIVDVVIGGPAMFGNEPLEAPDDPDVGRCPDCKGRDVVPWPKSRRCPKCKSRMKKGDLAISWD